jgi:hypothetical protein
MSHHFPIMDHIPYQNFSKQKSQFPSQFYFMKFYIHITTYFYQVKIFSKVTNIHLYTNKKN